MGTTTTTEQDLAPSMTAAERKAERETRGPVLRDHAQGIARVLLEKIPPFAAQLKYVAGNLFTPAEVKAGKLDAYIATWTGLKSSTWKGYIRVGDILAELDPKQVEQVQGWTLDSIKVLGPMDEKQREKLLKVRGKDGGPPSETTVKEAGKRIRPTTPRNTPDAAQKTTDLAEKIRDTVLAALMGDRTRYTALIAGAQLAQDNPGADIAAAILHLSVNDSAEQVQAAA